MAPPLHSTRLLHYFEHPSHGGEWPDAAVRVSLENPACGDQLVLTARLTPEGRIDARFLARGCVAALAAAEALCHLLDGQTPEQAARITRDHLIEALGGLPAASGHAAALAMEGRDRVVKQLEQSRRS